jgi:hypothetical protein
LNGKEGDVYSWIGLCCARRYLLPVVGPLKLSFDPAAETGAARNIALLSNLNAIEITDYVVPAFLRRSISW